MTNTKNFDCATDFILHVYQDAKKLKYIRRFAGPRPSERASYIPIVQGQDTSSHYVAKLHESMNLGTEEHENLKKDGYAVFTSDANVLGIVGDVYEPMFMITHYQLAADEATQEIDKPGVPVFLPIIDDAGRADLQTHIAVQKIQHRDQEQAATSSEHTTAEANNHTNSQHDASAASPPRPPSIQRQPLETNAHSDQSPPETSVAMSSASTINDLTKATATATTTAETPSHSSRRRPRAISADRHPSGKQRSITSSAPKRARRSTGQSIEAGTSDERRRLSRTPRGKSTIIKMIQRLRDLDEKLRQLQQNEHEINEEIRRLREVNHQADEMLAWAAFLKK